MSLIASDWLLLAAILCAAAWFANRRFITFLLPFAVAIAAFAVYLPTGSPRFTRPPAGDYKVIGADIDVNVAIYVLLKPANGQAVYYRLPYTNTQADQLQNAMDGEGGAKADVGEDGGVRYDGAAPVTGSEAKTPETPAITLP